MVSDGSEVGEVRAENVVDLVGPDLGITVVVEVTAVDDRVGPLTLDQAENRPRVRPESLISDERDREVDGGNLSLGFDR
jgi:hypothetical protein